MSYRTSIQTDRQIDDNLVEQVVNFEENLQIYEENLSI